MNMALFLLGLMFGGILSVLVFGLLLVLDNRIDNSCNDCGENHD